MEPRDASKIVTLIKAVNDHKGFKQMASYNLSCLNKLIAPPLPVWKENLSYALKNGGLEACKAAVQANSGDEGLLLAVTSVLDQAGKTIDGAKQVMISGTLDACLESIEKNTSMESGAARTTNCISNIANTCPEAIVGTGTLGKLYKIMDSHQNQRSVTTNCLATLEKVSKDAYGMNEIVQAGGIATVINTLSFDASLFEDEDNGGEDGGTLYLKPAFALIRRFASDNEANIEYLRQCGAVDAVIGAMDQVDEREQSKLVQSGGALLSTICSGDDLMSALATMNDDNASASKVVQMTSLVSNLALDSKNSVDIVKNGGVDVILKGLGSEETSKTASQALARLADNAYNAQIIIDSGGVEQLSNIVQQSESSLECKSAGSAALSALSNLSQVEGAAAKIVQSGGLEMACQLVINSPSSKETVLSTLTMIESVVNSEHTSTTELMESGATQAVVKSMLENHLHGQVQARSLEVASIMCHGDDAVINQMVETGVIKGVMSAMQHGSSKQVTKNAMTLLQEFVQNPAALEAMEQESDMVTTIVEAMNANFDNKTCMDAASETLASLVRPMHVSSAVAEIKQLLPLYNDTCDDAVGQRLKNGLNVLAALASNEQVKHSYRANDVPTMLKQILRQTMTLEEAPELQGVITAASRVIQGTVASGNMRDEILQMGMVKTLVQNMKCHPTFESSVSVGLSFVASLCEDTETVDVCINEGGVEACISSLRAHGDTPAIVEQATNSLLAISSNSVGIHAVVEKGAGRHLLGIIDKHAGEREFSNSVLTSIRGLNKIADDPEGRNLLQRHECKGIISKSISSTQQTSSTGKQYSTFLGKVMSKNEMEQTVADCMNDCESASTPDEIFQLCTTMETLSAALSCEEHAEVASKTHLAYSLVNVIAKASAMENEEQKTPLLNATLKSLGNYTAKQEISTELGAAAWVCNVLRTEPESALASLECIRDIALDTTNCMDLVEQTAVELVAWKMAEQPNDQRVQNAGMAALGSIIKSAGYENIKDRCEAAGVSTIAQTLLKSELISQEDSNMETCINGLKMFESMDSKSLVDNGGLNVTIDVLETHCFSTNPEETDDGEIDDEQRHISKTEAMRIGLGVLSEASRGRQDVADDMVTKGTVNKVLSYHLKNENSFADTQTASCCLDLLSHVSASEGLDKKKASECIVEAMTLNPTNKEIMNKGGNMLSAYITKDDLSKKLAQSTDDILVFDDQSNKVEVAKAAKNLATVATMSSATGILDESNAQCANQLLEVTSKMLTQTKVKGKEHSDAMKYSVQLMSRLAVNKVGVTSETQTLLLQQALTSTGSDDNLKSSAIGCIGSISTNGADGVTSVANMGGLEAISAVVTSDVDGSTTTSKVAREALSQITESATSNADTVTSDALCKIVEANAVLHDVSRNQRETNNSDLEQCVEKLSTSTNGQSALLSVLSSTSNDSAKVAVIDSIGSRVGEGVAVEVAGENRDQVKTILSGVRAHMSQEVSSGLKRKNKAAAADILGCLKLGDEGSGIFAEEGGLDILSDMIATEADEDARAATQKAAVKAMMNIVASDKAAAASTGLKDSRVNNRLKDLKIASVIAAALATSKDEDDGFADDCISLLQELTSDMDPDEIGLDDSAIRNIQKATDNRRSSLNSGASFIKSLAHMSQVAAALAAEGHVNEEILLAQWEVIVDELRAADVIVNEVLSDDGKVYYYNTQTGATSWTRPNFPLKKQGFERLVNLLEGIGNKNIPAVHNLAFLLKAIETQADDIGMLSLIFSIVEKWSANDTNVIKFVENNCIIIVARAIHKIMSHDDRERSQEILKSCGLLVGRFSSIRGLKAQVLASNAIQLLMHVLNNFIDFMPLVKECIVAFGNFAFNNDEGVKVLIDQGIIKLMEKVLQTYPSENRLMELTLVTLSNLMYGNDIVKKELGLTCGDEIVDVVKRVDGSSTQKAAMRCLGNLASIDENIKWVLQNNGAAVIVNTIESNMRNADVVQTAIEVLGNLASIDDPQEELICHKLMLEQGTAKCIIKILWGCKDIKMIISIWDCLSAITVDEELCDEYLVPEGIVGAMAAGIKKYDWNEDIVDRIAHLIHSMCYFEDILIDIAEEQIVPNLLAAAEAHADNSDLLVNIQSSITILATHEEEQEIIVEEGGLEIMYRLMSSHRQNKEFLLELLNTMIQIACNEKYVATVALTGMSEIINAVSAEGNDPESLSKVLVLLGQFALHEKLLNEILSFGGIGFVINAASEYPDNHKLVMSAIQMLDNMGTASAEHACILNEEGGLELLRNVEDVYSGNDGVKEIALAAKGAIMTIEAQLNLMKTSSMGVNFSKNMFRHLDRETSFDKLAESRQALSSGIIVVDWSMSKKVMRMKCSSNYDELQFLSQLKSKAMKRVLPLDDIKSVTIGRRYGGHSSLTGKAKQELSFYITIKGGNASIEKDAFVDLEGKTQNDVSNMVRAIRSLLRVWREDPEAVKQVTTAAKAVSKNTPQEE